MKTPAAISREKGEGEPVRPGRKRGNGGQKAAPQIAAYLRQQIATGALQAGEKLVPERVLVEQFNVSRPTLREAMRLLEADSLIKITRGQHGGATVQPLDISVTARHVGLFLQMQGTTLDDVWQARGFIEPPAAGLIAKSRSAEVIAKLKGAIQEARESVEGANARGFAASGFHFSSILVSEAGNKTIAMVWMLLQDIVLRQLTDANVRGHSRDGVSKIWELGIKAREKLVDLVEGGDADGAERYWKLHLVESSKLALGAFRGQMPISMIDESILFG